MGQERNLAQLSRGTISGSIAGVTATADEVNQIDDATPGTVVASKAIVVDSNKDIATFRHITLSGNLVHGSTTLSETDTAKIDAITNGTAAASKALVADTNKAVDILRATTEMSIGGTGVAGAAAVRTLVTKAVTAFSDTVAKAVFTVTVPNAAHAAVIEVDCLGVLGAGGAIGAGEGSRNVKYQVVLARTAGVNVVATASAAIGGAEAHVAGAASVSTVVVTVSAITGAVGASNTFTINVAITKSGGSSDNHTGVFTAHVLNQNATGVTIG